MAFKFPFTNYHELNLTWVLDQLKKLFEESAENVSTIQNYDGRLTAVETELPVVSENASEASRVAAAADTLAQTAKATADTAKENAIQAQTLAGTARQEAQAAQTAAGAATQAAQQAQATAQNFDGRITQAENDAASALEASRSFENRVQSAITTANNAARTATDAQGVAQNANQNAAAALDKIGDLSALDTTAKQNLVAAINEALENGGKVDSVNGQTGAVVLDAGDIDYDGGTVESALDGKQNAPETAGTAGQVLGLNSELEPVWVNKSGGDCSNCAPIIINNASGAIASFSDGADNLQIRKIVGTVVPVQVGSGTPSPDNERPISGYTEANIIVSPTTNAADGVTLPINWETEAGTIYGGTVTLNEDGSVVVLRNRALIDLSTVTSFQASGINAFYRTLSNTVYALYTVDIVNPYLISDRYKSVSYHDLANHTGDFTRYCIATRNDNARRALYVYTDGTQTTKPEGYALLRILNPVPYYLTDVGQLYTFLGANNVWIDTGSITECKYPADTKLYIDGKIAELQALVLENNG